MSRSRSGRTLLALALGAILVGPQVSAAEPRAKAPSRQSRQATMAPRDLFTGFWGLLGRWTKEGCMIDPHGRCLNDPAPAQLDAGCMIDPHGGCKPSGS
jgi:hypothetical protein